MAFETILTPELIDAYTQQGYWTDRTITDCLDDAAARTPDKAAYVDSRRQVTFAQLRTEVDRFAAGLLELGITTGMSSRSRCRTGSSGSSSTSGCRASARSATR